MKFLPTVLISALLFITINGCIKITNDKLWQQIALADSLMFIQPDRSLNIISTIEGIDESDDATKAYHHLISTQAKSRNSSLEEGDTSILESVRYYSRNKSSLYKLAWSLVYASQVNELSNNDSLSLKYIREAAKVAEENEFNDNRLNMYIYNFWGNILYNKRPFHDAIDKYLIAMSYAQSINDTAQIISGLINIGSLFLKNHEYEAGRNYFERAINLTTIYPEKARRLPRIHERISTSDRKSVV